MQLQFAKVLEKAKTMAKEKPFAFVAAALAILAVALFWKQLLLVLRGLLYAAIALLLIFAAFLLWVKIKYQQQGLKKLFSEKKKLLSEIKITEKKYIKRKLSEQDFNKIFKEKQQKLIEIEALLDQKYNSERKEKIGKQLLAVQTKKRHILKSLLEEKKRVLKEMGLAEKRYLRRKINAKTYQQLVQRNQQRLIELEAQIKQLYNEANVSKVMLKLKERLGHLEKEKKGLKKKKQQSRREQELQIAKEIAEQVSKT